MKGGFTGQRHTHASRTLMSANMRTAWADPETRAQMIEAKHKASLIKASKKRAAALNTGDKA